MSEEAKSLLTLILLLFAAAGVFVVTIAIIMNLMEQYETQNQKGRQTTDMEP
jgi:hypothetical protein